MNERFDRYEIEATIGEGGMGRVYRALDPRLKRTVALKVLRAGATPEDAAWLLREAHLAAQLEHPNVVRVYDSGEVDGQPFIVMEYVRGRSLRDMAMDKNVSLDRKLGWLVDVARALAAAHRRGLVHRDVKPTNVMVREEDDVAKVLDFGIARHVTSNIEGPTLTGQLVGTPQYMAPEQMRGEAVDGRADQFAWGVMAHALLTGKTPWNASDDPAGIAFAVLTQEARPLRDQLPSLPPAMDTIVRRTLSKQTGDRFATTDDLVFALEEATTSISADANEATRTTVTAAPEPKPERRQQRRRRRLFLGLASVATVVVIASAGLLVAKLTSHTPAHDARESPSGTTMPLASGSGSGSNSNVTVTDLPAPVSTREGAVAAYKSAMQAYRGGQPARFRRELEHTFAQDPDLAAAHLRFALFSLADNPGGAREHFSKAIVLRNALDEHDRALVHAVTPILQENPSNYTEAIKRLRAALLLSPKDAELSLWLAIAQMYGSSNASPEVFDSVLAIDPEFAPAYANKIEWLSALGRTKDALHAVDACMSAIPSAAQCIHKRALLLRETGDCAALERDAGLLIAIDKLDAEALYLRAEAEQARNAEPTVVSDEIHKALKRRVGPEVVRPPADFSIAVLAGNFSGAETLAHEHVTAVLNHLAIAGHAQAARELVDVLAELGDAKGSATAADDYLRHRDAWELDARDEAFAISRDPTPLMLAAELRAHTIDDATFARERDVWAAKWRSRVAPRFLPVVWAHGWAAPAETPAQAIEALSVLGQWGTDPPRFNDRTHLTADIGRTYALAGKHDDANLWLRTAAAACTAIERPFAHVQAHYWLGRVAQDTGDRAAACIAFADVIKIWGHAAHSVTAADAKARSAQLHCDK